MSWFSSPFGRRLGQFQRSDGELPPKCELNLRSVVAAVEAEDSGGRAHRQSHGGPRDEGGDQPQFAEILEQGGGWGHAPSPFYIVRRGLLAGNTKIELTIAVIVNESSGSMEI